MKAEVDQIKSVIATSTKTRTSVFRSKLLEKCRKVFKEEIANYYIICEDPKEKEHKMKQFTLGSKNIIFKIDVNFIGELINNKILSKKIVFQCVEHLFQNKGEQISKSTVYYDKTLNQSDNKAKGIKFCDLIIKNERLNLRIMLLKTSLVFQVLSNNSWKYCFSSQFENLHNLSFIPVF